MKKEIWEDEELKSAISTLAISILVGAFAAYIGYSFCIDNEYDAVKGVIFGFLLPFVYGLIYSLLEIARPYRKNGFFTFVLTVLYVCVVEYIPTWIGFIAIAVLLYLEILRIRIAYREATTEKKPAEVKHTERYYPQEAEKLWKETDENTENEELEDEEFYCERCFEKISEEEYEGNDGLCESCYEDELLEQERK